MIKTTLHALVIGSVVIALAQPAGAQTKPKPKTGTWEAVKALSVGTVVRVKMSDKSSVRGRVQEVTADSVVVVNAADQAQTLARDSVVRLSVKVGGNRAKNAAIGAAIGAGAGAGFGSSFDAIRGSGRGFLRDSDRRFRCAHRCLGFRRRVV
jgi:hypothetical protein